MVSFVNAEYAPANANGVPTSAIEPSITLKVSVASPPLTSAEATQALLREPLGIVICFEVNVCPVEDEFQAPEGKEFDAEIIGNFSEVAKELNLTQDAAQKLVETMGPKIAERQLAQVEAIRNEWAQQSQVDKEFGGDKLNENMAVAKKALDSFGTPELRTLLQQSGLGNNPEVIRFMYRAGKAISEDTFVSSSAGAGGGKANSGDFNSKAAALYSNQQS